MNSNRIKGRLVLALAAAALAVSVSGACRADTFELSTRDVDYVVPPDGSEWHELYPDFCYWHEQEAYDDADENGLISPDDVITMNGLNYRVEWVGPTYYVTWGDSAQIERYLEPMGTEIGGDPTGETWHEVHPMFCSEWLVEGWQDNGDSVLSEYDYVEIAGYWFRIAAVELNISATICDPVEPSTWGRIKHAFRSAFQSRDGRK